MRLSPPTKLNSLARPQTVSPVWSGSQYFSAETPGNTDCKRAATQLGPRWRTISLKQPAWEPATPFWTKRLRFILTRTFSYLPMKHFVPLGSTVMFSTYRTKQVRLQHVTIGCQLCPASLGTDEVPPL